MSSAKLLKVTSIFILEQLREPVGVFWSAIFPLVLFGFLVVGRFGDAAFDYRFPAALMLAYIAVTNALFGFSLYLVGRRESGFLKMFIQSSSQKILFLTAQAIASFLITVAYMVFFIIAVFVSCPIGILQLVGLLPGVIAGAVIVQFGALALAMLPVTHTTASSVLSMILTPLVLASLFSVSEHIHGLVAEILLDINPVLVVQGMALGWRHVHAGGFAMLAALMILGAVGYVRMQVNPVWNRQ